MRLLEILILVGLLPLLVSYSVTRQRRQESEARVRRTDPDRRDPFRR